MKIPAHVLELLSVQHDHIDELLARVRVDQRREHVDELADYVTAHLAIEQELLYPRLDARISDAVRVELLAEHQEIKRVLANLLWLDLDDQRVAPTLASLEALFEGHSVWQDEELFESLAQTMSPTALAELGDTVNAGFDRMRGADLAA
ncbi:MAG: hemerythrin domain-containing protein [Deltaproteobacteria bacterium]|nr:hemerythrin domain-containing protein [Deltaproteobacteria bacterium]